MVLTFQQAYLIVSDVYSVVGRIGNPLSSVAVEMLYTASVDAIAIQILSNASHLPGHILVDGVSQGGETDVCVKSKLHIHSPSSKPEGCLG
jgi:hypothetical protein